MIRYQKQTLLQRLKKLYLPEEAEAAHNETQILISRYKEKIKDHTHRMDEKDSILITYGDSIQKDGQKHLKTLADFSDKFLSGILNTIHILPFYPYSSDDGFSVIDYKAVNPDLGDWSDINKIAESKNLMFDGVINHISQHSDWFKGYLAGDEQYKDWFIDVDPEIDLSMVVRPRALPLLSPFEDHEGNVKYIWTTFSRDQVDLNYGNHRVLTAVLDVLLHYVAMGAKLIRLDAIAFVWKKIGTNCIHLEETHQVIQFLRDALHKVDPGIVIITETNVPHKENISYFGSGEDEAQMVYNFALPPLLAYGIISGDCSILTEWASTLELPSDNVCFFNFTASHDGTGLRPVQDLLDDEQLKVLINAAELSGGRVSMRSNGDGTESPYELNCNFMDLLCPLDKSVEERVARMLLSQGVTLAMPGVPGVYIHSLLGSRNDIDAMMKTKINRSINREKLCWNRLATEIQDPLSHRHPIFDSYRKMLKVRTSDKAFNPFGHFEIMDLHPSIFVIERESTDHLSKILVLANFGTEEIAVDPGLEGEYTDLLSGWSVSMQGLTLVPYEQLWLKIR